jgi:hypothetical protein
MRTATYIERVGTFMSNGVAQYKLDPPCSCGASTVLVDDYTTGPVKCQHCKAVIIDEFSKAMRA